MKKKNILIRLVVLFFVIFYLTGCFLEKPGSGKVALSGTLGTGYNLSKSITKASNSVTKLVAVAIDEEDSSAELRDMQTVDINPDGTFSMSLDKDLYSSSIFLLVNPDLPKSEKVLGYISISDVDAASKVGLGGLNNIATIIKIPVGSAKDKIDLGSVNQSADEAVSSNTIDFTIPVDKLINMSKTDKVFKIIKSLYINYNGDQNSVYNLWLTSFWNCSDISLIKNTFNLNVASYSYKGYSMSFNLPLDNPFYNWNEISGGTGNFEIYPPAEIQTTTGWTYNNTDKPFKNDGLPGSWSHYTQSNGDFASDSDFTVMLPKNEGAESPMLRIGILNISNLIQGPIPTGYWRMLKDNSEISIFDFGVARPFYGEDTSKPNIYIPAAMVTVDTDNVVQKIEFKWFLYNNQTGQYDEITNLSGFNIGMVALVSTTNSTDFQREENMKYSMTKFQRKWYFYGDSRTNLSVLKSIRIVYNLAGGIDYNFTWEGN